MNDPEQLKHNITEEALKNGTKVTLFLKQFGFETKEALV
jgi:hypothetical protein